MLKRAHSQIEPSAGNIPEDSSDVKHLKPSLNKSMQKYFQENRESDLNRSPYLISTLWLNEFLHADEDNDTVNGNKIPTKIRPLVLALGSAGERVSEPVYSKLAESYGVNDKLCAIRFGTVNISKSLQIAEVEKSKPIGQVVGSGNLYLCGCPPKYTTEADLKVSRRVNVETPVSDLQLLPTEYVARLDDKSSEIQLPSPELDIDNLPAGHVALVGHPNIAFINSSLQVLLHIPQFAHAFLGVRNAHSGNISSSFIKLTRDFYTSRRPMIDAMPFIQIAERFHAGLAQRIIQDSFEFIVFMLESLQEDLVSEGESGTPQPPIHTLVLTEATTREVINEVAERCWNNLCVSNASPVSETFMGMNKVYFQCPVCRLITTSFEPFTDITVPIPGERPKLRDVVIILDDIDRRPLQTRVAIPQMGTVLELKNQLIEILPELAERGRNLITCEVFDGKVYKILSDNDIVAHKVEDCDDLVVYEVKAPASNETTVPCFLNSNGVGFALPFFINVNEKRLNASLQQYSLEVKQQLDLRLAQQSINPPPVKGMMIYRGPFEEYLANGAQTFLPRRDIPNDDDDEDEEDEDEDEEAEEDDDDEVGDGDDDGDVDDVGDDDNDDDDGDNDNKSDENGDRGHGRSFKHINDEKKPGDACDQHKDSESNNDMVDDTIDAVPVTAVSTIAAGKDKLPSAATLKDVRKNAETYDSKTATNMHQVKVGNDSVAQSENTQKKPSKATLQPDSSNSPAAKASEIDGMPDSGYPGKTSAEAHKNSFSTSESVKPVSKIPISQLLTSAADNSRFTSHSSLQNTNTAQWSISQQLSESPKGTPTPQHVPTTMPSPQSTSATQTTKPNGKKDISTAKTERDSSDQREAVTSCKPNSRDGMEDHIDESMSGRDEQQHDEEANEGKEKKRDEMGRSGYKGKMPPHPNAGDRHVGVLVVNVGDFTHSGLKRTQKVVKKSTVSPVSILGSSSPAAATQDSSSPPTPPRVPLDACLEQFVKTVSPPDLHFCRKCSQMRSCVKRVEIWEPPQMLLLRLDRFPGVYNTTRKIEDLVEFPLQGLNMSRYISPEHRHPPDAADLEYDLFAVNNHFGDESGEQQYTSVVRDPFNINEWTSFHDTIVVPASEIVTPAAYLLFYVRRTDKAASAAAAAAASVLSVRNEHQK